jgi:serine/threonine protein kinase
VDSPARLLDGTPYRFQRVLGRGGMAIVLEATHGTLGTTVAVKVLHAELGQRQDLVERARIEAQVLARLSHPHIVSVSDFGVNLAGQPYMVMERLVGSPLDQEHKRRGPLPPEDAVNLVLQLLSGLSAAHAAGVVHRDIKLSNLFVTPDPGRPGGQRLLVLDFGIAKLARDAALQVAPNCHPTEEGSLLGTPRFVAPEQALGKPVDHRADLYAAGLVLYVLLAGRGPFVHHSLTHDLLRAHVLEVPEPPSRWLDTPLPAGLDEVVLTALAKDPNDRYADAGAFADALAETVSPPAEPIRWGVLLVTALASTAFFFLVLEGVRALWSQM